MKKTNLANTSGLVLQRRTRIFDLELAYALRYFKGEKTRFYGRAKPSPNIFHHWFFWDLLDSHAMFFVREACSQNAGFRYPLFPVNVQVLASRLQLLLERITPTQPGTSNLFYDTNKSREFLLHSIEAFFRS